MRGRCCRAVGGGAGGPSSAASGAETEARAWRGSAAAGGSASMRQLVDRARSQVVVLRVARVVETCVRTRPRAVMRASTRILSRRSAPT